MAFWPWTEPPPRENKSLKSLPQVFKVVCEKEVGSSLARGRETQGQHEYPSGDGGGVGWRTSPALSMCRCGRYWQGIVTGAELCVVAPFMQKHLYIWSGCEFAGCLRERQWGLLPARPPSLPLVTKGFYSPSSPFSPLSLMWVSNLHFC